MDSTSERDATNRPEPSSNQVRTINLALQGGGAHGAFTWGVLDRLLDEEALAFEGLSATSAGAMNAAAFAYGLAVDGREGARKALEGYWKRVSDAARQGLLQPARRETLPEPSPSLLAAQAIAADVIECAWTDFPNAAHEAAGGRLRR